MLKSMSLRRQQAAKLDREAIFAQNRLYGQLQRKQESSVGEEDGYGTMVGVFFSMQYRVEDVRGLLEKLKEDEVEKVYWGVVGLCKIGERLVTNFRPEQLIQMRLVQGLASIVRWPEHPYLLKSATNILHALASKINTPIFHTLFNERTLPASFFLDSVSFGQGAFKSVLSLLSFLRTKSQAFLSAINSNIDILSHISGLLSKETLSSAILSNSDSLLALLAPTLNPMQSYFSQEYFRIRKQILLRFKQERMNEKIIKMIQSLAVTTIRGYIHSISVYSFKNLYVVAQFFKEIIDLAFQEKLKHSAYSEFIRNIIRSPNSSDVFPKMMIFEQADQILAQQLQGGFKHGCQIAKQSLKIMKDLIYLDESSLRLQIASRLPALYMQKQLNDELNSIVLELITSQKEDALALVKNHSLLSIYVAHCTDGNKNNTKNSLKRLHGAIHSLKSNRMQRYEAVRKIMGEQGCFQMVMNIKSTINSYGMDYVFSFFDRMDWEEKPVIVQDHQAQVSISSLNEESDPYIEEPSVQQIIISSNEQEPIQSQMPSHPIDNKIIILQNPNFKKRVVIDLESDSLKIQSDFQVKSKKRSSGCIRIS